MNTANANQSQSPQTLYEQLANTIRQRISSGQYPEGSQLPTEEDFQVETSLSRSTVRHALRLLVAEGTLVKIHGKGSFVQSTTATEINHSKFFSLTKNAASKGITIRTKLVNSRKIRASSEMQHFFRIEPESEILEITRLRYAEDDPFCVETSYFASNFFSIAEKDLDNSLYELLRIEYNVIPAGGHKSFGVTRANTNESFLLNVPCDTPLMTITDYVYDEHKLPIHISHTVMLSDKYHYELAQ
jgi:GntR family transcriptional regulator